MWNLTKDDVEGPKREARDAVAAEARVLLNEWDAFSTGQATARAQSPFAQPLHASTLGAVYVARVPGACNPLSLMHELRRGWRPVSRQPLLPTVSAVPWLDQRGAVFDAIASTRAGDGGADREASAGVARVEGRPTQVRAGTFFARVGSSLLFLFSSGHCAVSVQPLR